MATFKKTEQPGIQTVQSLSADPSGNNSPLISAAGQATEAGIKFGKKKWGEHVTESLEGEIESTAKSVATINEAMAHSGRGSKTFDPKRGDVLYIEGAPQEFTDRYKEVMKEAGNEFRGIAAAVAQGATPKAAAALQIEAKLKHHISLAPEFAPELRDVARRLSGYDPTGYHLKQILDITDTGSKTKTFAQKKQEEAEYISQTLGVPIEIIQHNMAEELYTDQRRKVRENMVANGSMELTSMILNDISDTGAYMDDFYVQQHQLIQNGGVTNPETQVLMMQRAKATHRANLMAEASKVTKGYGVDKGAISFMDEQLNQLYDPIVEAIKSNDFGKILERKNKTLLQLDSQYGRQVWPRLVRMNNALGERLTSTIIDQMSSFANNEQWLLYAKKQPLLWEAIQGANMAPKDVANHSMDIYEKVITNRPLTEDDRKWLPAIEPVIFHPKQDPEIREKYLKNIGSEDSRGVGWLAQKGKRAIASEKDVEWMKREWKGTVPALVNRIADTLVERPDREIVVTPDGKLRMVTGKSRGNQRPVFSKEVEQLQYFLNAAKNGWANDFGTTATGVLADITKQITQEAENREGTESPDVMESIGEGVQSVFESINSAVKDYEDIVTGKKKPNDPNAQLKVLKDKLKQAMDSIPDEFQGTNIRAK